MAGQFMSHALRHVLSASEFDVVRLESLYQLAATFEPVARGELTCNALSGAILANLFFEPSTRTRLSFGAAFQRLGGRIIEVADAAATSVTKGESLGDTARVVSGYADVLVVRHPDENGAVEMAARSLVPVVNGGNGAGEHPTQALLDLYTIRRSLRSTGREVSGLTVGLVGDLKHGRAVHSLIRLLVHYPGITFLQCAIPSLELPESLERHLRTMGHAVHLESDPAAVIGRSDVLYVTRLQEERLADGAAVQMARGRLRIDRALVERHAKASALLLHPLPRDLRGGGADLAGDVDDLPQCRIFQQTDLGVPVRMALLCEVLGVERRQLRFEAQDRWLRGASPAAIGVRL